MPVRGVADARRQVNDSMKPHRVLRTKSKCPYIPLIFIQYDYTQVRMHLLLAYLPLPFDSAHPFDSSRARGNAAEAGVLVVLIHTPRLMSSYAGISPDITATAAL